jgi:WD40 repeat protein
MKTESRHDLRLVLACFFCPLAFPAMEAAEPARLGELRGVWQAHFNHDASRMVVRTRSGEIGIWDPKKGTPISGDLALKAPSNAYVMSPDARKVLVGFKDGHARVFDTSTGAALSPVLDVSLREDANAQALFSPDGGTIVFFGDKGTSVLDAKTGRRIATVPIPFELEENSDTTAAALFVSTGSKCLVMEPHGTVTAYETKGWTRVGKPMKHPAAESAYDFGFEAIKDGKWIFTFDDPGENGPKGQLQAWDATTNKALGRPLSAVNGMSGRFLPGKDRVLVQSGRGEASIRNLPSMEIAYVIKQHDELDGPKVEIFPNGKWLLAWGPDKKIDLIDAASGKILASYSSPASITGTIIPDDSAAFYLTCENGDLAAENRYDNALERFSVPEMKSTASTRIPDFILRQNLSPNGSWMILLQGVTDDEKVVIFDTATLKPFDEPKP